MRTRRWALATLGLLLALVLIFSNAITRRVRAAQFLSALSKVSVTGTGAHPRPATPLVERELLLPGPGYGVRARLYYPANGSRYPGIVIAHGVHYRGIDERRLVPFARAVAATGRVVLTPELRDLTDYRITEQGVEVIESSTRWLSERTELIGSGKVGVLGFSFAGGLALVAAERPSVRNRIEFVSSVGGHHDLARVLRFLVSDRIETPTGTFPSKAHEYGLVVLLYQYLDHFVEEPDRAVLEDSLRLWLHEERDAARARASQRSTLRGEELFMMLESGRLKELRPELERLIAARQATLRALSPRGRLPGLGVPVYLLHGSADSVIPPSETDWAAHELDGHTHLALVSPLLEHVEVNKQASLRDEIALVEFMAHIL